MFRCAAASAGCIVCVLVLAVSLVLGAGVVDSSDNNVGALGWVKPVEGATISQTFGCTTVEIEPYDATCASKHFHSGVDLAVRAGTPVVAAAGGVARVVISASGFGLHVIIDHGNGLRSLYGHLRSVVIDDGQYVDQGEQIGTVGSSGNSTGPHLHFEIDRDGVSEDPGLQVGLP